MVKEDPCPAKTTSLTDFIRELERDGFADEIKSARGRLSVRVQQAAEGRLTLRALRLKHEMSQTDLAEKLKTSQPHVARLESGRAEPGRTTMKKLAEVFGLDMNTIDEAFEKGSAS